MTHPEFGAKAPALQPESAVSYGSHNTTVLKDILRYDDARIAQLAAQGALQ